MSAAHLAATGSVAGDTWGLTGPQFLGGYVVLGVLLVGVAGIIGIIGNTGRQPGNDAIPDESLTLVQVGLLGGGGPRAVTVAFADLRSRRLIDVDGRPITPAADAVGRPVLTKPAAALDDVTRAVHAETGAATSLLPTVLLKRPAVGAAVGAERRRLEAAGLVTTQPRRFAVAVAVALGVAFVTLGIARVIAGAANHKPTGLLVLVAGVAAIWIPVQISRSGTPRLSRSGKQTLHALRRANQHLSPSLHPSWSTYGPQSIITATALFGGAVMFTADPAFAESINLSDAWAGGPGTVGNGGNFSGSGGNFSGSGGSCGGGGGCGGGGCGGGGCGG